MAHSHLRPGPLVLGLGDPGAFSPARPLPRLPRSLAAGPWTPDHPPETAFRRDTRTARASTPDAHAPPPTPAPARLQHSSGFAPAAPRTQRVARHAGRGASSRASPPPQSGRVGGRSGGTWIHPRRRGAGARRRSLRGGLATTGQRRGGQRVRARPGLALQGAQPRPDPQGPTGTAPHQAQGGAQPGAERRRPGDANFCASSALQSREPSRAPSACTKPFARGRLVGTRGAAGVKDLPSTQELVHRIARFTECEYCKGVAVSPLLPSHRGVTQNPLKRNSSGSMSQGTPQRAQCGRHPRRREDSIVKHLDARRPKS